MLQVCDFSELSGMKTIRLQETGGGGGGGVQWSQFQPQQKAFAS